MSGVVAPAVAGLMNIAEVRRLDGMARLLVLSLARTKDVSADECY